MRASERRLGAVLLACGCLPFAAGALVPASGETGLTCPFRAATGLPCPLCGATRAFALASRGDGGWVSYNAPWVVLAALAILLGAAALAGIVPLARARGWLRTPPRVVAAVALPLLVGWAYALAQRATIVG